MTRIPSHTIQDAPEASRPLLDGLVQVSPTWQRAVACGWDSTQLAEAFADLGLTLFTAYFLNYAQTPVDLPGGAG